MARDNYTDKDEYVVDRMVDHIVKGDNLRYVVRWYGYGPIDDTVELAHYIPQHFITRHWRRINKTDMEEDYIWM